VKYNNITFLSDYGLKDEFVGVCKSVIRTIAPEVKIIDLTHEIAPFDIRAGSLTLVRSANYLAPGVVLAMVDPEAGTSRRAIAVELGEGESVLIGPDNGLLAPVTALAGGATRIVQLANADYWLGAPSPSFEGRDMFSPVAAHICNGVDLGEFGPELDAATLVPALVPFSGEKDGILHADAVWIDRYGNVQLNVSPSQIEDFGDDIVVTHGSHSQVAERVRTFAEVDGMQLGMIVDSSGLISLVVNQGSAASRFGIALGDAVTLRPSIPVE
jgi:S-adenosyl-L-methionine hydrolase (adenosine-forming)